jgi:hypothetical protein
MFEPIVVLSVLTDSWRVEKLKPACVLRLLEVVLRPSCRVDILDPTVVLRVLVATWSVDRDENISDDRM